MNRTIVLISMMISLLLAPGCVTRAAGPMVTNQAEMTPEGIRELRVVALAGELVIEGRADAKGIRIQEKTCSNSGLSVFTERQGDAALVRVEMATDVRTSCGLDLSITVPAGLAVRVTDSSGAMRIRGVGPVTVTDSSGDIVITEIAGKVTIETDSSGGIEITKVEGDVHIAQDSSGEIVVREVTGSVTVDTDSSGDIEVEQVGADVHIGEDSSGDIRVARVEGTFTVQADGSGEIVSRDVKGTVQVPR